MSVATGSPYRTILGSRRVVAPFAASVVARVPISMTPLGIVVLVQHVLGSYGTAGIATGAFAVGTAVGAPVWGRAMDRFGQPAIVAATSLVSAVFIAALALLAVGGAGALIVVGLALLAGVTFPAVSPAMRSAWRVLLPGEKERRAGYALDAVAVESIFVVGPLLLSLFLVFAAPVLPLLVTAALLAGGGLAYSRTDAARRCGSARTDPRREAVREGRVFTRGMVAVLAVSVAMAVGFGCIDTSLAATAREVLGSQAEIGLLFMAIASGSAVGGLSYGSRHHDESGERRRLATLLAGFAAGLVPLPLLLLLDRPALWMLMPLLFLAGLSIAPALIIMQSLVDRSSPVHRVNEAQAWLSTANTTGAAAGTAAAGGLIDAWGVRWSFAGAALSVATASALAFLGHSVARSRSTRSTVLRAASVRR